MDKFEFQNIPVHRFCNFHLRIIINGRTRSASIISGPMRLLKRTHHMLYQSVREWEKKPTLVRLSSLQILVWNIFISIFIICYPADLGRKVESAIFWGRQRTKCSFHQSLPQLSRSRCWSPHLLPVVPDNGG